MLPELTDYLLRLTFRNANNYDLLADSFSLPSSGNTSEDILRNIYSTLSSEKNYKTAG